MLTVFSVAVTGSLLAAVNMTGVSDSTAVINESFTANVIYTYSGTPAPTFTLEQAPSGMNIGSSSGTITYSPDDMSDGGRITVKATQGASEYFYHFSLYISSAVECSADLISYYKLDETGSSTSFADYAGGYTATSGQALTGTTGKIDGGQIMAPDAVDNVFMSVTDVDQYEWTVDEDFSFSFWIYPYGKGGYASAGNQVLATRWLGDGSDKFMVLGFDEISDELFPRFRLKSNGLENDKTSPTAVPLNQWVHIAFVYDAFNDASAQGYMRIFMNGTQVMNSLVGFYGSTNFYMDNVDLSLGYFIPYSINDPFNGVMDEVLIYDKALNQADIDGMMADGAAGQAHCKPGNTAPEFINNFPATIDEDASYLVNLVTNDIEDDPVTITEISTPSWMTYSSGPKQLSGNPTNDDVGTYTITFELDDGTDVVTKNIPIEVVNVNDLPTISSSPATSVNEDVAYTYTLVASDVDVGDVMTMTAEPLPGWLTFTPGTGVLQGTCTNDDFTSPKTTSFEDFDIELRVYDLSGEYTPQTFTIRVTNVNDAPVINGQNTIETDENVAVTITMALAFTEDVNIIDVDNEFTDLSLTVQDGTNYTHAGNTVTPAANYSGTLAVPVNVSDGQAIVSTTLNVNVAFVNDIPEVTSTDVTAGDDYEDYEYVITVEDSDPGDVLEITGNTIPDWLTLTQTNNNTAILSGMPLWDDIGANAVVIDIDDGHLAEPVHHSFTITVGNTNTPPEIISTEITYAVIGEVYAYNIEVEDPDEDDDVEIEALSKPSWLALEVTGNTALLYGTPTESESGSHDILIQATDGKGGSDQQNFQLTVGPDAVEDNMLGSFNIFPVPASDILYIEYDELLTNATLEILNITGKTMMSIPVENGSGKLEIDVNSFESGMYLYRLTSDNQHITGRIIIE